MITLGDYALAERIAAGGMAEVWSATHVPTESQVAVKLAVDDDPRLAGAIHAEATAMAMLRSPRVVRIHEVGVVTPSQHQHSGGKLRDGAPWIAMEWLPGGTLADPDRVRSWPDLQFALLDVLQALAHAHAHGLVHRDVKPANVLVEREGPLRVKLADFGITFARRRFLEGRADAPSTALTPMFAAPEQLRPDVVRQGPWTDLYQLGSLAWAMVSGAPPFGSPSDPRAAARGHLKSPVPPLRPRFPVPADLQKWVERLMEKQPADRFAAAADAAEALRALDPMPAAQRRAAPPAVGQRIVGAALASLRTPQLVGRSAELAALRAVAERVRSSGEPRIVLVRGPAGVGTTALVEAATLAAEERGEVVCVRAGETSGASGGLARLCSAALGQASGDVDQIELALQSRPAIPPFREPLSALLEQRLEDRAERFEVAAELLRWRADRLLVLWIDPPHGGGELVPFAEWLRMTRKLPALVVISASDEHLAEHPQVVAAADQVIGLGPLEPSAMLDLVADVGTVDTATAARIAARSAGQPGVAVELVRDLLLKGGVGDEPVLQGLDGPLPGRERWDARRQELVARFPGVVPALQVAAALGPAVDASEWAAVCAAVDAPFGVAVVAALTRNLVLAPAPAGYRFVQPGLRENVLEHLGEAAVPIHRACATVLEARGAEPDRIGAHLQDAGDDRAFLLLINGAKVAGFRGDPVRAAAALDRAERGLDDGDPRRSEILFARIERARTAGATEEALHYVRHLLRLARSNDSVPAMRRALMQRAAVRGELGDPGALDDAEQAVAASAPGPEWAEAACWHGMVLGQLGRIATAEGRFEAALRESPTQYLGTYGLGCVRLDQGRAHEALARFDAAMATADARGDRQNAVLISLMRANALRALGRPDEAEAIAREAELELVRTGLGFVWQARLAVGFSRLAIGEPHRAGVPFTRAMVGGERARRMAVLGLAAVADRTGQDPTRWLEAFDPAGLWQSLAYEREAVEILDRIASETFLPDVSRLATSRADRLRARLH